MLRSCLPAVHGGPCPSGGPFMSSLCSCSRLDTADSFSSLRPLLQCYCCRELFLDLSRGISALPISLFIIFIKFCLGKDTKLLFYFPYFLYGISFWTGCQSPSSQGLELGCSSQLLPVQTLVTWRGQAFLWVVFFQRVNARRSIS